MALGARKKLNIVLSSATPLYLPIAMAWSNLSKSVRERIEIVIWDKNYHKMFSFGNSDIIVGDPLRDYSDYNFSPPDKGECNYCLPLINKMALVKGICLKSNDKAQKLVLTHNEKMTTYKYAINAYNKDNDKIISGICAGFETVYFEVARRQIENISSKSSYKLEMIFPDTYFTGFLPGYFKPISIESSGNFLTTATIFGKQVYDENSSLLDEFCKSQFEIMHKFDDGDIEGLIGYFLKIKQNGFKQPWGILNTDLSEIRDLFQRWGDRKYFSVSGMCDNEYTHGLDSQISMSNVSGCPPLELFKLGGQH